MDEEFKKDAATEAECEEETCTEGDCDACAEGESEACECDYKEQADAIARELAALEAKLAAAVSEKERETARAKDVNGMYVRLQADFDNYRKRTTDQLGKAKEDGVAEAMTKVIPTLDVIGQALQMITDEKVAEGVQMINRQLLGVLQSFGVTEIPALGKEFDPELHNAILQVKADKPDAEGRVIEVFQKGYRMGERILRHSVVKVAR